MVNNKKGTGERPHQALDQSFSKLGRVAVTPHKGEGAVTLADPHRDVLAQFLEILGKVLRTLVRGQHTVTRNNRTTSPQRGKGRRRVGGPPPSPRTAGL